MHGHKRPPRGGLVVGLVSDSIKARKEALQT